MVALQFCPLVIHLQLPVLARVRMTQRAGGCTLSTEKIALIPGVRSYFSAHQC
jgi:hypothetical protein